VQQVAEDATILGVLSLALIGDASAQKFPKRRTGPEAFSIRSKEEAAGICGGRGYLWDLNSVFLDNETLKVSPCASRSTIVMAANHTALRVEGQDLFEDQLRTSDTRSVRRASGLVLVGKPEAIAVVVQDPQPRILADAGP